MVDAGFITRAEAAAPRPASPRRQAVELSAGHPIYRRLDVSEQIPDLDRQARPVDHRRNHHRPQPPDDRRAAPCAAASAARAPSSTSARQPPSSWTCAAPSWPWSAASPISSSQFNRAVKAKRQPGSAFKPFVYLTALEQGPTPDSVEIDEPVRIGDWEPENYKRKYLGRVTPHKALALSLNTVAAKLAAGGRARRTSSPPPSASASIRRCRPTPRSRSAPPRSPCLK